MQQLPRPFLQCCGGLHPAAAKALCIHPQAFPALRHNCCCTLTQDCTHAKLHSHRTAPYQSAPIPNCTHTKQTAPTPNCTGPGGVDGGRVDQTKLGHCCRARRQLALAQASTSLLGRPAGPCENSLCHAGHSGCGCHADLLWWVHAHAAQHEGVLPCSMMLHLQAYMKGAWNEAGRCSACQQCRDAPFTTGPQSLD